MTQNLIIAGMFGDTIDIGNYTMIPVNSYDDFITKMHWSGTTGIIDQSVENGNLTVYPNPASNQVSVSLSSDYDLLYYEVVDVSGNKILMETKPDVTNIQSDVTNVQSDVTSVHACQFNINISGFPPGLYLINTYTAGNKVFSKKIIKTY